MNRLEHLLSSPQIDIHRFDHQPDSVHDDPAEEVCQDYAVHFVAAGSFQLTTRERSWVLAPGTVFISRPGAVHRYSHDEKMPSDVCISAIYSHRFVEENNCGAYLLPAHLPTALPATNRLAFLQLRLADFYGAADVLVLENWACELIAAVGAIAAHKRKLYGTRQLSWYAKRIETAREILDTRYAEQHSLATLAAAVGMSPFQFARVFSELKGVPPHRYLLKVRLEQALKMIRAGKSVTETCFDVGFLNLSHFTRTFCRRFGHSPSLLKPHGVVPRPC
jgi:AraC family transcriptional regulator